MLAGLTTLSVLAFRELETAGLGAEFFASLAQRLTYHVEPGPTDAVAYDLSGPFDERMGYPMIPGWIERLTKHGFAVTEQARLSPLHLSLVRRGLIYPLYREKAQAGLTILDSLGVPLYEARYPQMVYDRFESIPKAIVGALLLIEDRNLLDPRQPNRNPTLEWGRLARAVFDRALTKIWHGHESPGASTLATQIEKYRHSPDGRTQSGTEKAVQMLSATLRAYQDGPATLSSRQRVITDYVNSVPLGAVHGGGEIRGIGQGLLAWHGADFKTVNTLLSDLNNDQDSPAVMGEKAVAFKQVLSLFLAQRRPAYYLGHDHEALKVLVNKHLGVLERAGLISSKFRPYVEAAELTFAGNKANPTADGATFVARKAANGVRIHLLDALKVSGLYTLDRLDLTVQSTIDGAAQQAVTTVLGKLKDPVFAKANGLMDNRLLAMGDPRAVIYSFTLRERVGNTHVLRVQADNVDGPFNVSEGGKLELGSTAKLRTLVTYLEVIEEQWRLHKDDTPAALAKIDVTSGDHLTGWSLHWLAQTPVAQRQLRPMLEAAMNRAYSASPAETFFTGGGAHHFNNFESKDNGRVVDVREAVKRSINLPFIRIMRDIAVYYSVRIPHADAILRDGQDPARRPYLAEFAAKEGSSYLNHFYQHYHGLSSAEIRQALFAKVHKTMRHLGAVYSVLAPNATQGELSAFLRKELPDAGLTDNQLTLVYTELHHPGLTLQDRGFMAGLHPLDLWLAAYMMKVPSASFSKVLDASLAARQDAYKWLFTSHDKQKQDKRIRIMLEQQAFQKIHEKWHRLGYPFGSLVPTYATAIGSSGDRPLALADLMGILQSGGMKLPTARITNLHFAQGTPFETQMHLTAADGQRVLSQDLADTVVTAIRDVVDNGTAKRVKGAFVGPDGEPLVMGGKTGTGDNRFSVHAPGGRVIESKVMSRTATFVFYIGDRFTGTLTAYVPNAAASNYNFTSALPVQILKVLAPSLTPLVNRPVKATGGV